MVSPTKGQSARFVKKIYDLKKGRPNLESEIKKVSTGINESKIEFYNNSEILVLPYGENALGLTVVQIYRNINCIIGEKSGTLKWESERKYIFKSINTHRA